jgi:hypothetical protein
LMMSTLWRRFCLTVPVPAISMLDSLSRSEKEVKRLSKQTSEPGQSLACEETYNYKSRVWV